MAIKGRRNRFYEDCGPLLSDSLYRAEDMLDKKSLFDLLHTLPTSHCMAFGASCSERLLPNYLAFSQQENWGKPKVLSHALEIVWSYLKGSDVSSQMFQSLFQDCYAQIPPSGNFMSIFAGVAQNAAASICYTLEYYLSRDEQLIEFVSQAGLESVDFYLIRANDANLGYGGMDSSFEKWISEAPLMRAEREKQYEDLSILRITKDLSAFFLDELRESSRHLGIQPFLRGLIQPHPE